MIESYGALPGHQCDAQIGTGPAGADDISPPEKLARHHCLDSNVLKRLDDFDLTQPSLDERGGESESTRGQKWEEFYFIGPSRTRIACNTCSVFCGESYYKQFARKTTLIAAIDNLAWQGVKVFFIKKDDRFGVVCLQYGSCSLCDEMAAVEGDKAKEDQVVAHILTKAQWADTFMGVIELAAKREWAACEAIGLKAGPISMICRELAILFKKSTTAGVAALGG